MRPPGRATGLTQRPLGRTGLAVSVLGFGCGSVGGLLVRGAPAERIRAVARALELGVTFFDTAPSYGDGRSEQHLGEAFRVLGVASEVGRTIHVATKVRLDPRDLADPGEAVRRSLAASLQRLGLERVDLLQLHNPVADRPGEGTLAVADVRARVLPALEAVRRDGWARSVGLTALGDTGALHRLLEDAPVDTAQVCLNLLNPSAAVRVPPGFPGQDFGGLLERVRARGLGVIVIRVLAAGALSGDLTRHPVALPAVEPIATGPDYASDVARARSFRRLVDGGYADSLVEAALRFALGHEAVSTVLVGVSSIAQLEQAAGAAAHGPLPPAALAALAEVWDALARDTGTPSGG